MILTLSPSFSISIGAPVRNFGIMQEYNERRNKKLINNFLLTDRPKYWVTSSRPSNFGDPLDAKTKADNWFDENRYVSSLLSYLLTRQNSDALFCYCYNIECGMRRIATMRSVVLKCTWSKASFSATTSSV